MNNKDADRIILMADRLIAALDASDIEHPGICAVRAPLRSLQGELRSNRKGRGRPPADLTGLRFGRLVGVRATADRMGGSTVWEWACDCGDQHIASAGAVVSGGSRSCGCLQRESASERLREMATTHGGSKTSEWRSWRNARRRTIREDHPDWKHYGGRGISMHDAWVNDFAAFLDHIGPKPEPKHLYSLDRVDVNGNYEPGNVRWATRSEQAHNRRPNA